MNEKGYPFEVGPNGLIYQFESISVNKKIKKAVLITPTSGDQELYNLALLDAVGKYEFSDQVESRNGDLKETLATVLQIIEHFLSQHPDAIVGFQGNDRRRH